MGLGEVVAGSQNDGAGSGGTGAIEADVALVQERVESARDCSFEKGELVGVVVVEGGAVDGGSVGDVVDGDLVEALCLHKGEEGSVKELPGSSDARVADFTIGDRHRLAPLEATKEEKESGKQRVSSKESQHRRPSHQSDKTLDSYTREKEAIYQVSESDDNPRARNSRGLSAPSPGEGLRNALGNLEHRIHRRASARDKPQSLDVVKNHGAEEGRAAGGKGFATLVEELVRPCSREEIRGTIPFLGGLLICRRTENGF